MCEKAMNSLTNTKNQVKKAKTEGIFSKFHDKWHEEKTKSG